MQIVLIQQKELVHKSPFFMNLTKLVTLNLFRFNKKNRFIRTNTELDNTGWMKSIKFNKRTGSKESLLHETDYNGCCKCIGVKNSKKGSTKNVNWYLNTPVAFECFDSTKITSSFVSLSILVVLNVLRSIKRRGKKSDYKWFWRVKVILHWLSFKSNVLIEVQLVITAHFKSWAWLLESKSFVNHVFVHKWVSHLRNVWECLKEFVVVPPLTACHLRQFRFAL